MFLELFDFKLFFFRKKEFFRIWIFFEKNVSCKFYVSKEIQKYDQRKFYFFSWKKHFQIWYSRHRWKKNRKKNLQFFFRTPKFRIKYFAKYIILQTSNTKEILENIVKKMFAEIFLWKKKFSPQKNSIKKFVTKKKFVEKNFRKKNFRKKKFKKNFKILKF